MNPERIYAHEAIRAALEAAGSAGIPLTQLLTVSSSAHAVRKALTLGRTAGQWYSHKMPTDDSRHASRYWLKKSDMLASLIETRARLKALRKEAQRLRMQAMREAKRAGTYAKKPRQPAKPKPPKVAKPKPVAKVAALVHKPAKPQAQARAATVAKPASAKPASAKPPKWLAPAVKVDARPVIVPPGFQVQRIATPPGRYEATGAERFFSSLAVGNYLRHDSAIARAYA